MKLNEVYNTDFLNNTLPDKSVDLIISDPPYYEVKGKFDFIWSSFEDYLKDVELWAKECKRVLKDNGSLFWYGMDRKIAYSQIILDKYFNLLNTLVWEKPSIPNEWETRRSFPERGQERILFYSNEVIKTGLEEIKEKYINPKNPFSLYLREEFKRAKVSNKEIAKLFPSKTGGLTGCVSNWLNGDNNITEEQYLKIRKYLKNRFLRKEYKELRKEYEELRKEYEELRKEYEQKRRYFNNSKKFTDIIKFSNRSNNSFKHPTQKSEKLTASLILTTSREGATVLVPFAGSGTECAMSAKYKRNFIGFEIDSNYQEIAQKRANTFISTPQLF